MFWFRVMEDIVIILHTVVITLYDEILKYIVKGNVIKIIIYIQNILINLYYFRLTKKGYICYHLIQMKGYVEKEDCVVRNEW